MNRSGTLGGVGAFILGLGVGAAAALLLAPKSGEELRSDISEGLNDGIDNIRRTGRNARRKAERVVSMAKDQVKDASEAGLDAYSQAKNA